MGREAEILESIRLLLEGKAVIVQSSGAGIERKAITPQVMWVRETELPLYIPYSLMEIRQMRKNGIIKGYSDIRGGKRILYNLFEVSRRIQGTAMKSNLLQFDPESVTITL